MTVDQMREADFRRQVLDLAKSYRWRVYAPQPRHNPRGRPDKKGWLDLTLFRAGRIVILELKREQGGVVSSEQQEWLDEWQQAEARAPHVITVAVVRPSDLERIAEWLA